LKILIDAQLPPGLTANLRAKGHEAFHVFRVGLRDASDTALWNYALVEQTVISTKDEDFARRRLRAKSGPTIIWLRVGNCSNTMLQGWRMRILPDIERLISIGETIIEVRQV
jgi:predicted nuclease of predicted toxin-antitoxin system